MNRDDVKRERKLRFAAVIKLLKAGKMPAVGVDLTTFGLGCLHHNNKPPQPIMGFDIVKSEEGDAMFLFTMTCAECQITANQAAHPTPDNSEEVHAKVEALSEAARADALIAATGHGREMDEVLAKVKEKQA